MKPAWLLDPGDPRQRRSVLELLAELRTFEGKTFGEMMDEVEEINRSEPTEACRRLRAELVESLVEGREIEIAEGIIPSEARRCLFSCVWDRGLGFITPSVDLFQPATDEFYTEAAKRLGIERTVLQDCLYADVPESRHVHVPTPTEGDAVGAIIAVLNRRRLKMRLRRAVNLDLKIARSTKGSSPYAALLFSLKRNRLMYEVTEAGNLLHFSIRGPGAFQERSAMYGNRLASFVDTLVHHTDAVLQWMLEAEVLDDSRGHVVQNSIQLLRLGAGVRRYFPAPEPVTHGEEYKSSDEEAFQRYFSRLASPWTIRYEATLIPLSTAGGASAGFMIPDFVAARAGDSAQALIEIVGFWREDYLRRKIEKVNMLGSKLIFLIVNKALIARGIRIEDLTGNARVLYYSSRAELKDAASKVAQQLERLPRV